MKGLATRHGFLITHFVGVVFPFKEKRKGEERKKYNNSILTYSKRKFFYILLRDYMILAKLFLSHSFINQF